VASYEDLSKPGQLALCDQGKGRLLINLGGNCDVR